MVNVENIIQTAQRQQDAPIEIVVHEGEHLVYEIDEHRDFHNTQQSNQYRFVCKRASNFTLNIVLTGVGVAQHRIEIILQEEGAQATIFGALALSGAAHQTIELVQEHQAPHTKSYSLFLSGLTDQSALQYDGKITIFKKATGADAALYAKNLLLSNTARVSAMPSLEVNTNQVHCKHGTATSRCDAGQLLYLMSRGIDVMKARELLLSGFFSQGCTMKQDYMVRIMQQLLMHNIL